MSKRKRAILFVLFLAFLIISRGLYLTYPQEKVFDEVHYIRAASFYLEGQDDPNWEHPPLGKMFIALGMFFFGDDPLGWRFFPVLFGVLTTLVVFWTARTLRLGFQFSLAAAFLFSCDFLSFVQGQLAMLDVFVAFFITLAFLFLARFYYSRKKTDFFLTLIAFGLAFSSKWSALYPILLSGILFLFLRPFAQNKKGVIGFLINALLVVLSFLLIIGLTYSFSYSYYFSKGHDLGDWIKLHKDALAWHTRSTIDHPYASSWWTWPLMIKPVWYYYKVNLYGYTQGILAIGNPIVWYLGGIAVLILTVFLPIWLKRKRFSSFFSVFGYWSNFLPWIISTKGGFLFYMLPVVPYYALSLAVYLRNMRKNRLRLIIFWVVLGLSFLSFLLFYPLLTGLPVYKDSFLRSFF